jgi:hypothetical protein
MWDAFKKTALNMIYLYDVTWLLQNINKVVFSIPYKSQ